ncbi:hypothetical protein Pfra02_04530 [Pseudomonas fragi]|nr:hypothetical protein Pfra02_04530 [Pseudomonas fragi]
MTQEYIGTKQVLAWEQDSPKKVKVCGIDCRKGEADCNSYCTGGADRAPAHPAEPGYAVKYPDGYISWSPKAIFEAAYLPLGHIGHLSAHQQRVIGESVQLGDRLTKLDGFIGTELFSSLPQREQELLKLQSGAMHVYRDVLARRIEAF